MKFIYNSVLVVCVCALSLLQVHAGEQHTTKALEVALVTRSNQTTDSVQVSETHEKLVAALYKKQQAFEMRVYILVGITMFLVLLFGALCFFNKRGDKQLQKIVSLLENFLFQRIEKA